MNRKLDKLLRRHTEIDSNDVLPSEVEEKLADLLEEAEQAVARGKAASLEEILNRVSGQEQRHLAQAIYGMLRLKHADELVPQD